MANFGVAGSVPLALWDTQLNTKLMDAIKTAWAAYADSGGGTVPAASDILFTDTWFPNHKDIEMAFTLPSTTNNEIRGSTDRRIKQYFSNVDIQVKVRGRGGAGSPPLLAQTLNGLQSVIQVRHSNLIPLANCEITSILPGATEQLDDSMSIWHREVRVRVSYFLASIV